jgi:hypothetical protein
MKSNTVLTVIFVVIVAAVLAGEVYVYTISQDRYSSDIAVTGDGVDYSVTSAGSTNYSVLVMDNGDFKRIDRYYIYYDDGYGSKTEKVAVPVGAREFTQRYYIEQLIKMLENRGIRNVEILNAARLGDLISSDPDPSGKGLVVLSGALPDTVYNGDPGNPIFSWIRGGGSLYWAGNLLGAYYSTSSGTVAVSGDHQTWFFGVNDSLNRNGPERAFTDVTANDYRHTLSLKNNSIKYGVNVSVPNSMTVGYTDGTYGSTVMIGLGSGMICVLAGDYSGEQRHDLAQIISSGICHLTSDAGHVSGDIKRNTVTGTISVGFDTGRNYAVYIYCGGYFPTYGRTWAVVT